MLRVHYSNNSRFRVWCASKVTIWSLYLPLHLLYMFLLQCTVVINKFKIQHLPGKGKKGFSSCGESLFGGGFVGILLAKPFTGEFSTFSCCTVFVTLNVDFLRLFHRPENVTISKTWHKLKFKLKLLPTKLMIPATETSSLS